jgi:hypothetical protein
MLSETKSASGGDGWLMVFVIDVGNPEFNISLNLELRTIKL